MMNWFCDDGHTVTWDQHPIVLIIQLDAPGWSHVADRNLNGSYFKFLPRNWTYTYA